MTSYLSLQGSATLIKSFELALNVKNTLEELVAYDKQQDQRTDSYSTPSMEVFLKSLNDKGEHFCGRCADMIANYIDMDDVMSNQVERERERYHAAVPPPITKVNLQLVRVKGFNYTPNPSIRKPTPPVFRIPENIPAKVEPTPLPPLKLEEKYSIFADEKFNKLCMLLEKGLLNSSEKSILETPQKVSVDNPISLPTAPSALSKGKLLEESILGDRILELTHQLEDYKADILQQQHAIKLLCQTNKKLKHEVAEFKVELAASIKMRQELAISKVDFGSDFSLKQNVTEKDSTK
jgi:hypothetical protein